MPQVQPLASQALVRSEVQRAAARTAIDFDYLLGQARLESSLDPSARASNSSASGLFQFISSTWLETLQKHGSKHGLDWASAQIEQSQRGPVIRDPAVRDQILALRYDPQVASLMAGEFASDNRQVLQSTIGREPTNTDLYLAHFLGSAGASDFLRSMQSDSSLSAASLFPKAASANRSIFFDRDGGARSLGQVYGLVEARLNNAIDRNRGLEPGATDMSVEMAQSGWSVPAFADAPTRPAAAQTASAQATTRPSMTDLLRSSFSLDRGHADPVSANVRKAYGTLRAFGL